MNAIDIFRKNHERAAGLLAMHTNRFPTGRPPATGESPDLLRATIVFAVAAVDTYFHDKILENVPPIIQHCGKTQSGLPGALAEILKPALNPEKTLALLYRKRPDIEFRKILADHISDNTYQDAGQIERGLKLIGVTDIWEELRLSLKLRSKNKAKKYIQAFVTRRHNIVHEADLYKSYRSHQQMRPISRPFTKQCISSIERFIEGLDKIIDRRLSRRLSTPKPAN